MTTLPPYKTIVFDLDGTLLDTWPSLLRAVRASSSPNAPLIDPAALRLALSQGIGPMFSLAARQMAPSLDASLALAEDMARRYFDQYLLTAVPYANAGNMLASLLQAGHVLALCTNRDRTSTLALLTQTGWLDCFAHIHCLDDGLPAKPDPAPLRATLSLLDCPRQRALFVGDSNVDAQCAANAQVDFAAHLGGYHAHPDDLTPAVLAYAHSCDLTQWLTRQPAVLLETESD